MASRESGGVSAETGNCVSNVRLMPEGIYPKTAYAHIYQVQSDHVNEMYKTSMSFKLLICLY